MNYPPRSRSKKPPDRKIIIALGIFLTGAVLFYLFKGVLPVLVRPLWLGENILSRKAASLGGWFSSKSTLIRENAELKEKIEGLALIELESRASLENYSRLLETFGREPSTVALAAAILTHPPVIPYDILLIDAGSSEGVKRGAQIASPQGPIIGRVEEVLNNTSKVRLYSTNGERTNAVLERGNLPIIIAGQGGGNFRLILPRDIAVEVGDRILSPGIDSKLMAIVEEVSTGSTDSFKEVLARSPVNIFSIRYVEVLQ